MEYSFKMTKALHVEYLKYLICLSKRSRLIGYWIKISIPLLIIFTGWYFTLFTLYFIFPAVALSVIWVFWISNNIWNKIVSLQVDKILSGQKDIVYGEVIIKVEDDGMLINKELFKFKKIIRIAHLSASILFFYDTGKTFVIDATLFYKMDQKHNILERINKDANTKK